MSEIRFGTDGWRGIIADDFTLANVELVAKATADWMQEYYQVDNISALIGYDTRFGGEMFAETCAKVLCAHGIKVYLSKGFVSTPMVSLGIIKLHTNAGIVVTASHNPPSYNGIKIKAHFGGPALPSMISIIEDNIPDEMDRPLLSIKDYEKQKLLEYVDLETMYCNHLEENFDLELIRNSLVFGYDAMYGTGQNVMKKLFPKAALLHCEHNPSFKGQAPEPLLKNLREFSDFIKNSPEIVCGLATDGDADRLGMIDHEGNFVDSHQIILLLIHYLVNYKKLSGKVVVSFTVSDKIAKLCKHYNLPVEVTKVGFKYICDIMIEDDGRTPGKKVLLGGEESGGIALTGHIPERDGIWVGLTVFEFMAKTGKSLSELLDDIYKIVGRFSYSRNDLHINESLKLKIMENCKNKVYTGFGKYKINRVENIDGYKFFFGETENIMIRASGTEPVLRIYCEAETPEIVQDVLMQTQKILLNETHG